MSTIVACPNCGKSVNTAAAGCPGCGADPHTGELSEQMRRLWHEAAPLPFTPPEARVCPVCAEPLGSAMKGECSQCGSYVVVSKQTGIPAKISGFNWGAFFWTWIWGLGNGVYVTLWGLLLVLVPPAAFGWVFYCGFKGNEWAWERGRWSSPEAFRSSQRGWAIAALVWCGIIIGLNVVVGILTLANGA